MSLKCNSDNTEKLCTNEDREQQEQNRTKQNSKCKNQKHIHCCRSDNEESEKKNKKYTHI